MTTEIRSALFSAGVIAAVAFLLHLPWEFAHSMLYQCFPDGVAFSKEAFIVMHFRAALGDALLTLLLLALGMVILRSPDWWQHPTRRQMVFLALGGALLAVAIEYDAVFVAHRWVYADTMPTIFGIGLSPMLQLALLPFLTIVISQRFLRRPRVY
ncbi:MAG: hypothetical protein G01um101438_777 [Parcubacteria group bacterium Gr01-1014_38]|nr:MAG: hypothetical protein G01um101438_777 [Parcubacteria group bacterium Gr01-1014_38]